MTKTENLSLPQWVETDQIQRKDFNDAFAALDTGCGSALSMATTAKEVAEATAAVAYTPDNKPYSVGSYTGDGAEDWNSVTVGFRPSFVLITDQGRGTNDGILEPSRIGLLSECNSGFYGMLTSTGFAVRCASEKPVPELNIEGNTYDFIAFR